MERTVEIVGALFPDEEVQVSNDAAGYLEKVHVDFGSEVKQGQVLAELDKQEIASRLEQRRAERAQARSALADAQSKFESAQQLIKTGDIPQQRFTELEQGYQSRLAQVRAADAQVEIAEKALRDATIRSPFAGTVSNKLVSAGQYVRDKTPLLVLVKDATLRLRGRLPESAAGAARVGMDVTFTSEALPGKTFRARISEIGAALDPQSRTLTVEAKVPNPERLLKPGMFAKITVTTDARSRAVMVPRQAIYEFAGLTKLFLVNGNQVEELQVQTGIVDDKFVEVRHDKLKAGDMIAVSKLSELRNGEQVRPGAVQTAAENPSQAAK